MSIVTGSLTWVLVGIAAVMAIVWVWRTAVAARLVGRRPSAAVQALNLHDRAVGSLGRAIAVVAYFAAAIISAIWWPDSSSAGQWVLGIAAAVTIVALVGMELRWPVPGGTVRSAEVRRRRMADAVPQAGRWIAGSGMAVGLGAIVVCGWTAHPGAVQPSVTGVTSTWRWPGWAETWPLLVASAVVVVLAIAAVAVLLRRPALADLGSEVDMAYRRASVDRVLRVVAVFGLLAAALVATSVKNVALTVPPGDSVGAPLGELLGWQSAALFVAALLSVGALRERLPTAPTRGQAAISTPDSART